MTELGNESHIRNGGVNEGAPERLPRKRGLNDVIYERLSCGCAMRT